MTSRRKHLRRNLRRHRAAWERLLSAQTASRDGISGSILDHVIGLIFVNELLVAHFLLRLLCLASKLLFRKRRQSAHIDLKCAVLAAGDLLAQELLHIFHFFFHRVELHVSSMQL